MTTKDPHSTAKHLTEAHEILATSTGSAHERVDHAIQVLAPLQERDFPSADAKELLRLIRKFDTPARRATMTQEELEDTLESIWDLYWEMSSNMPYR